MTPSNNPYLPQGQHAQPGFLTRYLGAEHKVDNTYANLQAITRLPDQLKRRLEEERFSSPVGGATKAIFSE